MGKNKVAAVMNLDSNQPGSHWVSFFTNLETEL